MILEKPFVFVAMNYRLGFYGFLSSRELKAESLYLGEEYCPNQGLRDQRLALQWVRNTSVLSGQAVANIKDVRYKPTFTFSVETRPMLQLLDNLLVVSPR